MFHDVLYMQWDLGSGMKVTTVKQVCRDDSSISIFHVAVSQANSSKEQ